MDESRPEGRKPSAAPSGENPAGEPTRAARTAPAAGRTEIDQGMESDVHLGADSRLPQTIGRFSVRRRLGSGSFGEVLLAHDTQLDRPVALKFPRIERITSQTRLGDYIAEARSAARLRHPGIVPVYDVNTEEGDFFIVLEYVEGRDLAQLLLSEKLPPLRCVEVMIEIAEAVSYAHEEGLVHRDLKPANILVDSAGHPHVTDFGLAIHEKGQRLLRGQVAGTPYYMSPEQTLGEAHRLDGRTDIWSLGVVLYEMLTARRPFFGETTPELFDEIRNKEARPPRQVNRRIPRELERICLKCLSKRMADRYRSASELVDELRDWREESTSASGAGEGVPPGVQVQTAAPAPPPAPSESKKDPVRVIPKGLRSFDEEDAHFFLELLPGPFGREGLPESVRFWKTRIEEADPDKTFAVGLLFGPSGCGKTSLVKAGLIPRLGDHVRCAYVEATHEETEDRLIRGLRRACSLGPEEGSLVSLILWIREGEVLSGGEKVVIILDQFEQWLHAWQLGRQTELVQALRHCDGQSVQCLLLVRDGFAMSAMRLMKALEIPVSEGRNYATIDRFDLEHATEVLAHFGRAFGRPPEDGSCSAEQGEFLRQAVKGLSEHGQVVPLRLALFADMFRGKPWNPASLKKAGGTEGTGVAFLEEMLGASAANPPYRLHHEAARRVLRALLPEQGTNIRGHMLSHRQLLEVSGYARRPQDFKDLLRILDTELRLITPGDPREETDEEGRPDSRAESGTEGGRYQLTHDYLVPALREWLARKQRETLRGRTSFLLASQAELWNARPEQRYLPSLLEWVMASLFTRRSEWTDREGKMMRCATRRHLMRLSAVGVLFLVLLSAGLAVKAHIDKLSGERADFVDSRVRELLTAEWDRVPGIIDELEQHPELSRRRLAEIAEDPSRSPERQIRVHVALVQDEAESVPHLVKRLMAVPADGSEYRVLYDALSPYSGQVVKAARREIAAPPPGDSKTDIERKANAAVTLMRLGSPKHLWPLLDASGDPELRTSLIHRVSTFGVDVEALAERLRIEKDPPVEQAILLALGEYPSESLPTGDREKLVQQCLSLYQTDPDPGVHAGAEWLLRTWGYDKKVNDARRKLAEGYRGDEPTRKEIIDRLKKGSRGAWYVNSQGHTMIAIWMPVVAGGEQKSPAGNPADRTAGRIVALSAHEVTIQQYERFAAVAGFDVNAAWVRRQCPVNFVNWYDAAGYCRWLSDKEGISAGQNCYPPVEEIGPKMELSGDFRSQTSYRLPTEKEWEFACRAGTTTSRFFGENEEMLDRYAWYVRNSKNQVWPVGSLKPNPLGFFDVYGNVFEWCHPPPAMVTAGKPGAEGGERWGVIRGGAYNRPAKPAASHEGERFFCINRTTFVGFRIARTISEQQEQRKK